MLNSGHSTQLLVAIDGFEGGSFPQGILQGVTVKPSAAPDPSLSSDPGSKGEFVIAKGNGSWHLFCKSHLQFRKHGTNINSPSRFMDEEAPTKPGEQLARGHICGQARALPFS